MTKFPELTRRLSRRESMKLALAPAGAVVMGRWLSACASDAPPAGETAQPPAADAPAQAGTGASEVSGAAGGDAAVGVSGSSGAATTRMTVQAGSPAAGASGGSPTLPSAAGMTAPTPTGGSSAAAPTAGAAAPVAGSTGAVAGPGVMWAGGGTKSMMGPYPDPFTMGMGGQACSLYPAQTLGPCYVDGPAMREDISDGAKGLPTRLSFLVVQADGCTPVPGAVVDIWHSGFDGVYSGFGSGVCNPDSLDVADQMFCRGVLMTNEQGRVDFSTIFPGWYSSRAVHIHFTVTVGGRQATSQLYFEDDLITEIQSQGEYAARGMRSTTNTQDFIFSSGGASPEDVIMLTAKRPDGSLHAWKVLAIG